MERSLLLIIFAIFGVAQPAMSLDIPDSIINPIQDAITETLVDVLMSFEGETFSLDIAEIPELNLICELPTKEAMNMDIEIPGNEQRVDVLIEDANNAQNSVISASIDNETNAIMRATMPGSVGANIVADIRETALDMTVRGPNGQGVKGNMVVDFVSNPNTKFKLNGDTKSIIADLEVVSEVALDAFALTAGAELLSGYDWTLLLLIFVSFASVFVLIGYVWVLYAMDNFSDTLSACQQPTHAKEAPDLATVTCMACPDNVVNNWGANFCRGCGSNILYTGLNRESTFQPLSSIPGPPQDPNASLISNNPLLGSRARSNMA